MSIMPAVQDNPYQEIQDTLQELSKQRPNHDGTMDFHQRLRAMFQDTPNSVMNLAAWHWDDNFSTHVVLTPHKLPEGRCVYVAITRCAHSPDLALMADSCTKAHPAPPQPLEDVWYDTSQRDTVTVQAVIQDEERIPRTLRDIARAASRIASDAANHR